MMHFLLFIHFVCLDCMLFRVEVICMKLQYCSIYQYKDIDRPHKTVQNLFFLCELKFITIRGSTKGSNTFKKQANCFTLPVFIDTVLSDSEVKAALHMYPWFLTTGNPAAGKGITVCLATELPSFLDQHIVTAVLSFKIYHYFVPICYSCDNMHSGQDTQYSLFQPKMGNNIIIYTVRLLTC